MGFSTLGNFVDCISSGGKSLTTSFAKVTASGAAWVAGNWYDLIMTTGSPKINVYAGAPLEPAKLWYKSAGNIWHGSLQTPATKHITDVQVETYSATTVSGTLILCDYLQFYPLIDCDLADAQPMDPVISLSRYADGLGVRAIVVATAGLGVATPMWYVTYTNEHGDHNRTLSFAPMSTTAALTGSIVHSQINNGPFLPLQAGDNGIRSIDSVQLSEGSGAGYAAIVLVKPILAIPLVSLAVTSERSYIRDIISLPKIHDEACLNFLYLAGAAVPNGSIIRGQIDFAWGP